MMGRTHLAAAICVSTVVATHCQTMSFTNSLLAVCGAAFGSLLPDIDHRNSTISNSMRPISFFTHLIFGHRKLLHDPIAYAVLLGPALYFRPSIFLWALAFGILIGHLLLDALNPKGIPVLYLLTRGKVRLHLANIETNSIVDFIFGVLCLALVFVLVKPTFTWDNVLNYCPIGLAWIYTAGKFFR